MKEIQLGIALFLACTAACALEIVTIPTRAGVTQSFFIANPGTRAPEAVALKKPFAKEIE
jgi:hypothetical protein